ncbi:MAG: T9SS type A sorting domain-containing protein [Flavobacteriales bacterium]|nr:T9SS type A sorting domain-containing protein [Flavobacteriales bacterium]
MKRTFTFLTLAVMMLTFSANAQRYLDEVFDDVVVESGVQYGTNASVLAYSFFGEAIPENLLMDVYTPEGDTETERPLILYFHTGNFLPTPANGSTSGTRTDSITVELCSRFARMGYVVASCSYRLGWNPIAETQDERVNTLINAAYRGVQDSRTAVRYFRKDVAENGNQFGVDPTKIAMFGQGTGGYITLAAATLDEYSEVLLPKFTTEIEIDGNIIPVPMVLEDVNGDIFGTSVGVNPLDGDTLCYPNHVGYSSDFSACINLGGAMGDISWLEDGDMPMISFHAPTDPFAPYTTGILIVPGANLPVVEVSGSGDVQAQVAEYGNNQLFIDAGFMDEWSMANPGTLEGLYPVVRPEGQGVDSSPWDWWAASNPNNASGLLTNPDMSAEKGRAYADTIQGYVAPRLACALFLENSACANTGGVPNDMCVDAIDIDDLFDSAVDVVETSEVFTNVGATAEGDLTIGYECFDDNNTDGTNGAPLLNNTVWFTMTGDGLNYQIETNDCNGAAEFFQGDTQMAVYSGDCGNLVPVACGEDVNLGGGNFYSNVFFETEADVTYYIMVDGYDYTAFNADPATGEFCLNVVQVLTNVEENDLLGLNAYPNPATDVLNLNADLNLDYVRVYNMLGALVMEQGFQTNNAQLNVVDLEAGIYVVEITSGDLRSSIRFVKK